MNYDEFLKIVRSRRSIRNFKPDLVSDEDIQKILEAARWAMSGANGQPWEYVVVKDADLRKKIVDIYEESRQRSHTIESTRIHELRHPAASHPPAELIRFKNAPVIIVVCGDPRTVMASVLTASFLGGAEVFHKNLANTTQMIHLAASVLGLGAEWVSISRPFDERIKAVLGIPDLFRIDAIVPIGYAPYKPKGANRRSLEEILHWNKYDIKRFRSDEQVIDFIRQLRQKTRPGYEV